jgi:DNA-binding transcriptional ArsR family regulator
MEISISIIDDKARAEMLADTLKALANPIRLKIVAILCDGPAVVGALAQRIGVGQAIVSQELRILRMSGLVEAKRSGGFATYSLAEPRLKDLVACLEKCTKA